MAQAVGQVGAGFILPRTWVLAQQSSEIFPHDADLPQEQAPQGKLKGWPAGAAPAPLTEDRSQPVLTLRVT